LKNKHTIQKRKLEKHPTGTAPSPDPFPGSSIPTPQVPPYFQIPATMLRHCKRHSASSKTHL